MSRLAPPNQLPRQASRSSSVDSEPQLVGQLNFDGTASLKAVTYNTTNAKESPKTLKIALESVAGVRRESPSSASGDSNSIASDASEEDYDAMKPDPRTVVVGAKGGGFMVETDELTATNGKKTYEDIKTSTKSRPKPTRLKSIPVTLNRLNEKGRYILTADDDSLRQILRAGMERVSRVDRDSMHNCSCSIGERPGFCKEATQQV
jgi:sterol O-acyltransferase